MGSCSTPSRIFKGKIGAGQMGVEQVTVQNLDVVKVDADLNMIVIRGAIPGPQGRPGCAEEHRQEQSRSSRLALASAQNPQKASGR